MLAQDITKDIGMPVLSNFSIRTNITLGFLVIVFSGIAIVSTISYFAGRNLLERVTFDKLIAIRNIKAGQVVQYLEMLRDQCLSTSESTMIFDAMRELNDGFNALTASPQELAEYTESLKQFYTNEFLPKLNQTATSLYTLQDYFPLDTQTIISQAWYLANNPHSIQKKSDFARANISHAYNDAHEKFHSIFKRYAKRVGITDLYLVDLQTGHVVYSLAKEVDFGTNLISGPFKDSGLGKSFIEIQRTTDENFVKIIDFQFYDPSYGTPVGFISTPIYKQGKKLGALIFKFPIDTINQIMTYNKEWVDVGLGETGESFLMGKDKYMRTIARKYLEDPVHYLNMLRDNGYDPSAIDKIQVYDTTVLLEKIHIDTTKEALEGKTNIIKAIDVNGKKIISTYEPIKLTDIDWYVFVEMDQQEAFAPINQFLWKIIVVVFLILFFTTVISFLYSWFLTKPLFYVIEVLSDISPTQKISIGGSLEFIQLMHAYNRMVDHIGAIIKKIRSIQEYITSTHIAFQSEYTRLQEVLVSVQFLDENIIKHDQKVLNLNNTIFTAYQYDMQRILQNTHVLSVIKTLSATFEKNIESINQLCIDIEKRLLFEQERGAISFENVRDYSVIEVKSALQNITRILTTLVSTMTTVQGNYDQIIATMMTIEKAEQQRIPLIQELKTLSEENQKNYFEVSQKIEYMNTILQTLNTINVTYADLARQLVILIQEFEI